mgnify:CR=1 FL=1
MAIFSSHNDKMLARYQGLLPLIHQYVGQYEHLSQTDLQQVVQELEQNIDENTFGNVKKNAKVVAQSLALASVASQRTLGLTPFDVQYIGALTLLEGKIAQMRTGEGKTLTAALACFSRSLEGKGVHIVTVNEYLARRDSQTMGKIFDYLGKKTGLVYPNQPLEEKKQAYYADITYATNSELGFDFLRNNMALGREGSFMRGMHFSVVDEVDSILIDEARTPLIISANEEDKDHLFYQIDELASKLIKGETVDGGNIVEMAQRVAQQQENQESSQGSIFDRIVGGGKIEDGDYLVETKRKQIHMTEKGFLRAEHLFMEAGLLEEDDSLYAIHNLSLIYYLEAALKAQNLFRKNIEYIVKNNEVHIVDEFTGRVLKGRRWGQGVHQAIEAKERVPVKEEQRTVASITLQNLFREYNVLSGMTGTAKTEQEEFWSIYGLEVIVIPTNKPMIRQDAPDIVFLGMAGKTRAILDDIVARHNKGQPILVGTTSVQASQEISQLLTAEHIKHHVLNATNHEQESHIIAQAGKKGAVTIATNMAGRGTDIVLGGAFEEMTDEEKAHWKRDHQEVVELGGLHVIGTERHESRRIDDQLRGRAGRQGDPGSSQFYVSFDDELMRLFGTGWAKKTLQVMGMDDSKPLASKMVSNQIEKAQKAVERHNYSMRKELLEYDDVGNEQRKHLYAWRNWLIDTSQSFDHQKSYIEDVVYDEISRAIDAVSSLFLRDEKLFWEKLNDMIVSFDLAKDIPDTMREHWAQASDIAMIKDDLWNIVYARLALDNEQWCGQAISLALRLTDERWQEHLSQLDLLRKGIHLRGYAQKQPKQEYKKEAYEIFEYMIKSSQSELASYLIRNVWPQQPLNPPKPAVRQGKVLGWVALKLPFFVGEKNFDQKALPQRNASCSCGSGKRMKDCCGKISTNISTWTGLPSSMYKASYTSNNLPLPKEAWVFEWKETQRPSLEDEGEKNLEHGISQDMQEHSKAQTPPPAAVKKDTSVVKKWSKRGT